MQALFLNASKNTEGNTAALARILLEGTAAETIHLVEHIIPQIGQAKKGLRDDFFSIIGKMEQSDLIVIGTPVYWSDMTGYLKTFIDRLADIMDISPDSARAPLYGKQVHLIVQGTAPADAIPGITTVITHVCRRFHMEYRGIILTEADAKKANRALRRS